MVHAFISYSRRDVDFVKHFARDLHGHGVAYWRDQDDLPPWEAWDDEIEKMLRGRDITHFLYFHSEAASVSDNVKNEIALAVDNKRIKVFVLKLDDAPVPMRVYRRTYIDFRGDYGLGFNQVMDWLQRSEVEVDVAPEIVAIPQKILDPTPAQRIAAQDEQHQQVRIIAGPGTGKSFVIEERVRWLLANGVSPKRIFVVSFTRAASSDLCNRVAMYCTAKGQPKVNEVSVSTLHSLALRLLRKGGVLEAYATDPVVLSNWELEELFDKEFKHECANEMVRDEQGHLLRDRAKDIRRYHEALWSTGDTNPAGYDLPEIEVTEAEKTAFERFRREFSGVYSAVLPGELVAKCVEDFDYGLLDPAEVLGVEHLIVDEMQDLNHADNRFIDAIATSSLSPKLFVLGDDDQSVYAFRFAYPQGIQNLGEADRYPGLHDYELTQCFRCPPEVLRVATSVIQANHPVQRLPKNLVSVYQDYPGVVRTWRFGGEMQESRFIVASCKKLIDAGMSPDDILVLVSNKRTQLNPLEKAFAERDEVEADFPPEKDLYFDEKWMRFTYALVRVACDFHLKDYVGHRLLLGFLPGVGVPTCVGIKHSIVSGNFKYLEPFYEGLPDRGFPGLQRSAVNRVTGLVETVREWKAEDTLALHSQAIHDLIVQEFDNPELGTQWLEFCSKFPEEITLRELYSYLGVQNWGQAVGILKTVHERLGLDVDTSEFNPRVQVMTMHGAKGLNARAVFIPGLEDDIFPGPQRRGRQGLINEAARLLYVSITRASAACVMTYAKSRKVWGNQEHGRNQSTLIRKRFEPGPTVIGDDEVAEIMEMISARDGTPSAE